MCTLTLHAHSQTHTHIHIYAVHQVIYPIAKENATSTITCEVIMWSLVKDKIKVNNTLFMICILLIEIML